MQTTTTQTQENSTLISAYAKIYPNGNIKHIHYHQPYAKPDSELPDSSCSNPHHPASEAVAPKEKRPYEITLSESIRRPKTQISDFVLSNRFDLWTTFTFNGNEENKKKFGLRAAVDRSDIKQCKRLMSRWLNKQQQYHGNFSYLIVPEKHKDGAIHFHGFFKDYTSPNIKPTGKYKHGEPVYRIYSYRYGFSYAQYIDQTPESYATISKYIRKYITKSMASLDGKKRYWHSNDLKKPETLLNPSDDLLERFDFDDFTHKLEHLTIRNGTVRL